MLMAIDFDVFPFFAQLTYDKYSQKPNTTLLSLSTLPPTDPGLRGLHNSSLSFMQGLAAEYLVAQPLSAHIYSVLTVACPREIHTLSDYISVASLPTRL